MALGFIGTLFAGCALDGPKWVLILVLIMANMAMMMIGQRLLDKSMDDGFVGEEDIEEIEEAIENCDTIEQEFIMRNRRDNTFSIWSTEVKSAL